jgi:hypothetical protein
MQATGQFHGQVRELGFGVTEGIFDDPNTLGPADGMFDPDPNP